MAIAATLVGARGANGGTSTTTTGGTTSSSGSSFFVCLAYGTSQGTPTGVSDSKGNTYTFVTGSRFGGGGITEEIWKSENGSGGTSHTATVTFSTGEATTIHLLEVTGANSSGVDAVTGRDNTTSHDLSISVPASGSFTQADEILIAIVGAAAGGTVVYSDTTSTFTKISEEQDGNSFWTNAVFTRIISSTSSITTGFSNDNTGGPFLSGAVISIKQVAGGVGLTGTSGTFSHGGISPQSVKDLSSVSTTLQTGSVSVSGEVTVQLTSNSSSLGLGQVLLQTEKSLSSNNISPTLGIFGTGEVPSIGGHSQDIDAQGSGTTPIDISLGTTITGSTFFTTGSGLATVEAPTDSVGNTFAEIGTRITYTLFGSYGVTSYYSTTKIGGASHVISRSKGSIPADISDESSFFAVEIPGVNSLIAHTQTEVLLAGGPKTPPAISTTGPAIFFATWAGDDGGGPHTAVPDNGFTVLESFLTGSSGTIQFALAYKIVTSAVTNETTTWTATPSQGALLGLTAFSGNFSGVSITVNSSGGSFSVVPTSLSVDMGKAISGESYSLGVGNLSSDLTFSLSMVGAEFFVTSLVPAVSLSVSGSTFQAALGVISAGNDLTFMLTGVEISSSLAGLTPISQILITGENNTVTLGTMIPALTSSLLSENFTAQDGFVSPTISVTAILTGEVFSFSVGGVLGEISLPLPSGSFQGFLGIISVEGANSSTADFFLFF